MNLRTGRSGIFSNRSQEVTEAQMLARAPSIFAYEKHNSRSERYTYIPTIDVLRGLRAEGFIPVSVQQSRTRDEARREHTKHLVRMRHETSLSVENVGDEIPEIILINSHDGTSAYQMLAGCFRLACRNGLMVGKMIEEIRLPHKGNIGARVIEGAYQIMQSVPAMKDAIEGMKATIVSESVQLAFARAALRDRYADISDDVRRGLSRYPVSAEQLLQPRRAEDTHFDLWTVFNRVQENIVDGGLRAVPTDPSKSHEGRRVTTRRVTGIDQSVRLNRNLWTLAEEVRLALVQ